MKTSATALFEREQAGDIRIQVIRHFPLAEASDAHRALEACEAAGATILIV